MKNTLSDISILLRRTVRNFSENDPIMLAGALAFFTVFAIPPILIMIIFTLGLFMGQQPAAAEVFSQIEQLIGAASSEVLQSIVSHYFVEGQNMMQRLLAIGIFLFATSSFFIIIQRALNRIWNVHIGR